MTDLEQLAREAASDWFHNIDHGMPKSLESFILAALQQAVAERDALLMEMAIKLQVAKTDYARRFSTTTDQLKTCPTPYDTVLARYGTLKP